MTLTSYSIRMLASVRSVDEARCAVEHGADIIDCKEPLSGALGALEPETIGAIRKAVPNRYPVSATIGDRAVAEPDFPDRIARVANTGVDYIKIGIARDEPWQAVLKEIDEQTRRDSRLVGVMIADHGIDFDAIDALKDAGFTGVLLDTELKSAGALPELLDPSQLRRFIATAHNAGLFAGLAGALRQRHIIDLVRLKPDILGFRGALCEHGARTKALSARAVHDVRATIDTAVSALQNTNARGEEVSV